MAPLSQANLLREVRHHYLKQAVYDLGALLPVFDRKIDGHIGTGASIFTSASRLRRRRAAPLEEADTLVGKISDAWSATDRGLRHVARLLRRYDEPVRLLLCYESEKLEEMRQTF